MKDILTDLNIFTISQIDVIIDNVIDKKDVTNRVIDGLTISGFKRDNDRGLTLGITVSVDNHTLSMMHNSNSPNELLFVGVTERKDLPQLNA